MTLGRLSTGWLLWQSDDYLPACRALSCATDLLISTQPMALFIQPHLSAQAGRALSSVTSAITPARRTSVEAAYLAYFASEGHAISGSEVAGADRSRHRRGRQVKRNPLLLKGSNLFPRYKTTARWYQSTCTRSENS